MGAQQPHERVAENGIAQVADVRRFVGIDAGVLDQNLARKLRRGGRPGGERSRPVRRDSPAH